MEIFNEERARTAVKRGAQVLGFAGVSVLLACGAVQPKEVSLEVSGKCPNPEKDKTSLVKFHTIYKDPKGLRSGLKFEFEDVQAGFRRVGVAAIFQPGVPRNIIEFDISSIPASNTEEEMDFKPNRLYGVTVYEESIDQPDQLTNVVTKNYFQIKC